MTKTASTALRIIRLGRALDLTRAVSEVGVRESMISLNYWP